MGRCDAVVARTTGGALFPMHPGMGQLEVDERGTMRVSAYRYSAFALFLYTSCSAMALPLTVFRYESQVQHHCPGDTIVWLDFKAGRYYQKGQRRYASGFTGSFVCRNEARDSGYRRSLLGLR
jgi:hypothetical protein